MDKSHYLDVCYKFYNSGYREGKIKIKMEISCFSDVKKKNYGFDYGFALKISTEYICNFLIS